MQAKGSNESCWKLEEPSFVFLSNFRFKLCFPQEVAMLLAVGELLLVQKELLFITEIVSTS